LKSNVYNPIFSPISAAIMQRISIPRATGKRFFVILKNNILFDFREEFGHKFKDFFLNVLG
jgi:hypothetical protein